MVYSRRSVDVQLTPDVLPQSFSPKWGLSDARSHTHTTRVNVLHTQSRDASRGATSHILTLFGAILLSCTLGACSGSPSRNILGSYFPAWMVCALVGLAIALAARVALKASGLLRELPAPLVVLLSLGCATTFALWLLWLA
jgi:hypothetical protein